LIFSSLFAVVHFGWIISVFYLMSNSPEQMKVFSIQGIIAWGVCFAIGAGILFAMALPVSNGLEQMENRSLSDPDLSAITRRNSLLPVSWPSSSISLSTSWRA